MGSSKRVVLALLVSVMMVLSFLIGWVPSGAPQNANAATGSDGRVDMADLLNAVLNVQAGDPAKSIDIVQPPEGAVYKVPTDAAPVLLWTESVAPGEAADVIYGLDGEFVGEGRWFGNLFSGPASVPPGYDAAIECSSLLSGTLAGFDAQAAIYSLYAFAGASLVEEAGQIYVDYTGAVSPQHDFILVELGDGYDADKNGIPEGLLGPVGENLEPGSVSLAAYAQYGIERYVALANLEASEKSKGTMSVSPAPTITVTAPTLQAVQAAGESYEDFNGLFLVVSAATDLVFLLDEVDGSSEPQDLTAWSQATAAKQPEGGVVPFVGLGFGAYTNISLIYTVEGVGAPNIMTSLPEGLTVDIELRQLDTQGQDVMLASYPTSLSFAASPLFTNAGDDDSAEWESQGLMTLEDGAYVASLSSLSVFAPFYYAEDFWTLTTNVEPEGAGTVTADPEAPLYADGTVVNLVAAAAEYYRFVEWQGGASGTDPEISITMDADKSVTALFELAPEWTLEVNVAPEDAGTVDVDPLQATYLDGTVVNLLATAAETYVFVKWIGDVEDELSESTQIVMNGDKEVTALFIRQEWALTVEVTPPDAGEVLVDPDLPSYINGAVVNLLAVAAQYYQFDHWEGDVADPMSDATEITMDSDKTVVAVFSLAGALDVTRTIAGDGSYPREGGTIDVSVIFSEAKLALLSLNITEQIPDGWTYNSLIEEPGDLLLEPDPGDSGDLGFLWLTPPTEFPATLTYRLTVPAGQSGSQFIVGSGTYNPGTPAEQDFGPVITEVLSQWYLTTGVTPEGTGTVTRPLPDGDVFLDGTVVNLVAVAAESYAFDYWVGDVADEFDPQTTVTMDADKTVTAVFKLASVEDWALTVDVAPPGTGTVTVDPDLPLYANGAVVNLMAAAAEYYRFVEWQGDPVADPLSPTTTITMDSDKSVTAVFEPIPTWLLEVNVEPEDAGTVQVDPDVSPYLDGTVVNLVATAAQYYKFVRWEGDAVADPLDPDTTITMDADKSVTARFVEDTTDEWLLTVDVEPPGAGTVTVDPDQATYLQGTVVNLVAAAAQYYRFKEWLGGVDDPLSASTTILMDSDKDVTAVFERKWTLEVNVEPEGTGTVDVNPLQATYLDGTVVNLVAAAAEYYRFVEWQGDASGTDPETEVTMDADKSVTAVFELIPEWTLAVDVQPEGAGTVDVDPLQGTYLDGTVVNLLAAAAEYYRFVEWQGDVVADPLDPDTTITMDADKSVTAVFELIPEWTLEVNVLGLGSVTRDPVGPTYPDGTTVTLTAEANDGYQFKEWTGHAVDDPNSAETTITMDADKSVTAVFEKVWVLTVNVNPAGSGTVTQTPAPVGGAYVAGTEVTLKAVPNANYQFVEWQGNATGTNPEVKVTMDEAKTVTAVFALTARLLTVNILPDANAGAVVVDPPPDVGDRYTADKEVTLRAQPSQGYRFVKWQDDATGTDPEIEHFVMDADKTVTAVFEELVYYDLTLEVTDGGSVAGLQQPGVGTIVEQYPAGTKVTLTAEPAAGYGFAGWTVDGDPAGDALELVLTMNADKTVTATFKPLYTLTIQIEPAGAGAVAKDPDQAEYLAGTEVTLTANANAGFAFFRWEGGDLTGTDPEEKITLDANKTVKAVFRTTQLTVDAIVPVNWDGDKWVEVPDRQVWLFGGTPAKIKGAGFSEDMTVKFFGGTCSIVEQTLTDADILEVKPDSAILVVPPLPDSADVTGKDIQVDVTVEVGGASDKTTLVYSRYAATGDVITTAFYADGATQIEVALDEAAAETAMLTLPAPPAKVIAEDALAYGLVRASKTAASVGTDVIPTTQGDPIDDIWNLAVHLYDTERAASDAYPEIPNAEWMYREAGEKIAVPATLVFPVDEAALSAETVAAGRVAVWSARTDYDYVTDALTSSGASAYQATLYAAEYDAEDKEVTARIYDLGAISLRVRRLAEPPSQELIDEIAAGVGLDKVNDQSVAGAPEVRELDSGDFEPRFTGDRDAYAKISIECPTGGFAWVKVAFRRSSDKANGDDAYAKQPFKGEFPKTPQQGTLPGTNEFAIDVYAPEFSDTDDYDILIYQEPYEDSPVVELPGAVQYTAAPKAGLLGAIGAAVVGLGAALVGLAAGGDSGGGGGGPCFIATAAYGTPMAADIDVLRAIRDTYLLNNAVGTAFVDMYYHVSPAIADAVAASPVLAGIVRALLVPVVFMAKLALAMPPVSMTLASAVFLLAALRRRRRRKA